MDFDDFVQDAAGPAEVALVVCWIGVFLYFRSRRVFTHRADWPLIVGAWGYLIIDFDLLPEHTIGLPGLIDDLIVMIGVAWWVYSHSSPKPSLTQQLDKWVDDPDQPEPGWYSPGVKEDAEEPPGKHLRRD